MTVVNSALSIESQRIAKKRVPGVSHDKQTRYDNIIYNNGRFEATETPKIAMTQFKLNSSSNIWIPPNALR